MQECNSIAPLRSLTLDLPPSCIEFCPAHPEYFVVGTYNLQKEETASSLDHDDDDDDGKLQQSTSNPQSRNGSLVLFRLVDKSDISHVQTVLYPSAILDLHFHPGQERSEVMAVVSSTGSLSLFRLSPLKPPSSPLKEIATRKPLGGDASVLFLSCAWHPRLHNLIAVTTSSFQVHVLRVDDSWNVHETTSTPVITHTLEAWTVAFSPFLAEPSRDSSETGEETAQTFTIFSGGDDSKLLSTNCLFYTHRKQDDDEVIEAPYPTLAIRGHEAGVTAILPLSLQLTTGSRIIITGSYDDRLRVYSIHAQEGGVALQSPKLLAEENLGGGVWRLKLIRLDEASEAGTSNRTWWTVLILASCMHAGSRILAVSGDYSENCHVKVLVLGRFEEHKSMNYGSDFEPGSEQTGRTLRCVSTSFYDRLLCLWEGITPAGRLTSQGQYPERSRT